MMNAPFTAQVNGLRVARCAVDLFAEKKTIHMNDQNELDRLVELISELRDDVDTLSKRVKSCEVEIERLESHKADA